MKEDIVKKLFSPEYVVEKFEKGANASTFKVMSLSTLQAYVVKFGVNRDLYSHIVAELLKYFRELTQVMIGEAIDRSELIEFLKENKIK